MTINNWTKSGPDEFVGADGSKMRFNPSVQRWYVLQENGLPRTLPGTRQVMSAPSPELAAALSS